MKRRRTSVRDFFLATMALCPPLADRLRAATLVSEVEATGNYSYACDHSHGANYLLIGDAYSLHRPGVLLRRDAGHEQRRGCRRRPACLPHCNPGAIAGRAQGIRSHLAPRAETVFLVHLSGQSTHHARVVFGSDATCCAWRKRCCRCWPATFSGARPSGGGCGCSRRMYYLFAFAKLARSFPSLALTEREYSCRDGHVKGQ